MGLILQAQRRANEALAPHAKRPWPNDVFGRRDVAFWIGPYVSHRPQTKLILSGISEGVGTCSDLKGVDIAVLQYHWNVGGAENHAESGEFANWWWGRLSHCDYAVLLWPSRVQVMETVEKLPNGVRRVDPFLADPDQASRTVELLEFSSVGAYSFESVNGELHATNIYLTRTGLFSTYVPI